MNAVRVSGPGSEGRRFVLGDIFPADDNRYAFRTPDNIVGVCRSLDAAVTKLVDRPRYAVGLLDIEDFDAPRIKAHFRHNLASPRWALPGNGRWFWDVEAAYRDIDALLPRFPVCLVRLPNVLAVVEELPE